MSGEVLRAEGRAPGAGPRGKGWRWPVPERIRPTRIGFWFCLCAVLVGLAATNTGNNSLYMVLAVMLAVLVVSGVASRLDLRGLSFEVEPPAEIYANRPFHLRLRVGNGSRRLPRWMLVVSLGERGQPLLVPFLPRAGASRGFLEMMLSQRGRHRFSWVHVGTIFPLGLFHKGMRYRIDREVLVFPELYAAAAPPRVAGGRLGDGASHVAGWGHELHALRTFRPGDDPRRIHWKQSARTGNLVYTEREAEEGRRLSILFDNGALVRSDAARARFERLVSEAATAAVDALARGYEVELVTRDEHLPFGGGRRQRQLVLETLALTEPVAPPAVPLTASRGAAEVLRLALDAREAVA